MTFDLEFEGWNFSRQPCSQSLLDSFRQREQWGTSNGEHGGSLVEVEAEYVRGRKAVLCVFLQNRIGLERSAKEFFSLQFSCLTHVSCHIWELCIFYFFFF